MTSTSGTEPSDFSRRAERCSTPKRCCSSMTTMPSREKRTASVNNAWVPTTRSTSPLARPASSLARSAAPVRLVSSSVRSALSPHRDAGLGTVRPESMADSDMWCCSASTSVGAISAPWYPPATAVNNDHNATKVLPAPTSPCRSRCMGTALAMSASISAMARSCAPVRGKGRSPRKRSISGEPVRWEMPLASRSTARLRITSTNCRRSSSSKPSRRRAAFLAPTDSGWCTCHMDQSRLVKPYCSRVLAGSGSSSLSSRPRRSASAPAWACPSRTV